MAWRGLARHLTKEDAVVRIVEIPSEQSINGSDDYLAIRGAAAGLELVANAKPLGKPVIYIRGGSLDENVRAIEEYLSEATAAEPDRGIYQRGGMLVHVVRLEKPTDSGGIRRPAGALTI